MLSGDVNTANSEKENLEQKQMNNWETGTKGEHFRSIDVPLLISLPKSILCGSMRACCAIIPARILLLVRLVFLLHGGAPAE